MSRTWILALSLWAPAALAQAPTEPCAGIALVDGVINTATPLPVRAPLAAADLACATAIGAALKARSGLRAVTVAVRVPDSERASGVGQRVGAAYSSALAGGGVPAARIETLVPATAHGEQNTVRITYTERRARSVARIDATEGDVKAGADRGQLAPTRVGAELQAESFVGTGAASHAQVALADGSRLRLSPETLLGLGKMYLDEKLRRVVKLELLSGEVEADVKSGGPGSTFDIQAGGVVAGVRGTRFRMAGDAQGARVETLEGLVVMTSAGASVEVAAGFSAGAETGKPPMQPTRLLAPPLVIDPLQGTLAANGTLRWSGVSGATGYRVDVARDAEFLYDVQRYDAPGSALSASALKLPAGKWFWRVRGLNAQGFGGLTSKVYAFQWGG